MTSADALAAQLEAARLRWVSVEEGGAQQVQIDTPSQYRAWSIIEALQANNGDAVIDLVVPLARDWKGITQADLQGAAVGSSDPAPFSQRLLRLALLDRSRWVREIGLAAASAAKDALERIKAASGKLTALLDAQAGVELEGMPPPRHSEATAQAFRAWNLLANGMGGIDWTGLPYVVAHLGVADVPLLIEQLLAIKTHKPPDKPPPHGGME